MHKVNRLNPRTVLVLRCVLPGRLSLMCSSHQRDTWRADTQHLLCFPRVQNVHVIQLLSHLIHVRPCLVLITWIANLSHPSLVPQHCNSATYLWYGILLLFYIFSLFFNAQIRLDVEHCILLVCLFNKDCLVLYLQKIFPLFAIHYCAAMWHFPQQLYV